MENPTNIETGTPVGVPPLAAGSDLSVNQAEILAHTSRTGRYVSDETDALMLSSRGLLVDHGSQPLAGGMHYFTINAAGRAALVAHRAKRPAKRFTSIADYL